MAYNLPIQHKPKDSNQKALLKDNSSPEHSVTLYTLDSGDADTMQGTHHVTHKSGLNNIVSHVVN
jgi:hypothetical protein